ncbi:SPOR domain-containing protein [Microbulbifer sp. ZKSA002]|uniref:SPOR domain-containing protein n=1 Tax=Microbulbifer sp. ZKSA002 TaxID=3243388 RepID=UPI00403A501A
MRWIALSLVALNAVLFAWYMLVAPSPQLSSGKSPIPHESEGKKITLVSEISPEELPAPEKAGALSKESFEVEQFCTLLGPFAEEYQGEDLLQRIRSLQVKAELRDIEMQGQMRYWVYLPPLSSRREAYNRLRELQSQGIDSYVIPKGALENGISFGIFSERARAESHTAVLKERGVAAQFKEEPQTYMERWIVMPPGSTESLAEEFWRQLQSEYPDLDRRPNLCSEVLG